MSDAACWVAESIVGKKSAPGVMESFSFQYQKAAEAKVCCVVVVPFRKLS